MRGTAVLLLLILLSGCAIDAPRLTKVNGHTVSQTDNRFLGVRVYTTTKEIKTKAQKLDDLAIQKETREQDLDLKTEERQSAAAYWFGVALFGAAAAAVIFAAVCSGWAFWGTIAASCAALGIAFWSFEHLIPYLKWPAFAIGGAVVLWALWKLKDFSLIGKLKQSKPGKLL